MSEALVFAVPEDWRDAQWTPERREAALARLETDPDGYWRDLAARLDWITPLDRRSRTSRFDAKTSASAGSPTGC